jgi:hypothetical protein
MLNAPYIYPNPTRDCIWRCGFRDLCLATNRDDDVDYLKKNMYRKRPLDENSVYRRETMIDES